MKRKIVLTGGHLTPAMALIEELKVHDWDVYYFGRTKAMQEDKSLALEAKIIPEMEVKFINLTTGRFRRKLTLRNIYSMLKIPVGVLNALLLLIKVKPNIIVSFGGYLGLPTVIAAWILRIPAIIHEQISVAGLANKLSVPFATKIALSFPSSQKYYPDEKVVITGNPIQSGVFKVNRQIKQKYTCNFQNKKTIFITGGNQGARDLNRLVLKALPKLLKKYYVIHQIGSTEAQDPEWEDAKQLVKTHKSYFPVRFIPHHEMGTIYSLANLVICRSGANTICELGSLNKPALLVPLEPSLMNEQLLNAKYLEKTGLAIMRHEDELAPDTLINQIEIMFKNLKQYKLGKEYQQLFVKDGARRLYEVINSALEH